MAIQDMEATRTREKMSEIMKRMAESVVLDPENESEEAAQAALLLSHVAWNRCLGSDQGTTQYRSILSDMEMSNPELWSELAEPDPETLIRSLMEFKNAHYAEDRRNLIVCGMREGNVHAEWIEPEDTFNPLELIHTVLVHLFKGDTEEAITACARTAKLGSDEARELVAGIEEITREHGMDTICAEDAEFMAAAVVSLLEEDGAEAPYNLIDLPAEKLVPERTLVLAGIMNDLDANRGYFPRDAIIAAAADPELVTPALLQSIRHATDDAERLVTEESPYMAHLYAMYLLAQFRETRAYPLIAAFSSLPGELAHDLTGDFITEDLGRVLASVCDGDQRLIRELIESEEVNEYVRGQAMHALLCLVASGQAEHEDVLAYFGGLLRTDFAQRPSHALDELILHAAHLCPEEIIDDIRAAYERGVVNYGYISLKSVEKRLNAGRKATLRLLADNPHYWLVDNTIEEMEWWACFRQDDEEVREPEIDDLLPSAGTGWGDPLETIRRESAKVGRNDPCPCGSGRKYKKCCAR